MYWNDTSCLVNRAPNAYIVHELGMNESYGVKKLNWILVSSYWLQMSSKMVFLPTEHNNGYMPH